VAFVTENGLSIEEQSALNFLWLAPTIEGESLTMFGASDERYTIKGGSGHLIDQLAAALDGQIETSKLLEAIRGEADGSFTLSFGDGTSVQADYVIVAILRLDLPPLQRQGINELGYGTNAKVLAGFDQRVWYDQGATGEVFTDEAFQLAWDNSVGQDSTAGGITFYSGGQPGLDVGDGSPEDQAARLMAGFERVFPGVTSHHNGKVLRMHWPSYAFALGSYSCPTVGQYSTFFADISQPVGHLFFAGEHCSDAYWGFMNGGAESGRVAAENLLAAL
jgi:monoamine oxidase